MKLVSKLTIALLTAMCVVVVVNAYFRVKRELSYFEDDRVRDHEMVGRALGAALEATWRSEGRDAAMGIVDATETHFSRLNIRWIDRSDVLRVCADIWPDTSSLLAAPPGRPITRKLAPHGSDTQLHTCVPTDVAGIRQGAIELVERFPNDGQLARTAVKDAAVTAIAIATVSALVALLCGIWLVGRPMTALVEKARRIGRGDFSGPIQIRRNDEFAVLATEMNAMCDHLVSTLEQLRHADRLSTVGKLASGVAHELGTPLNVISARAAMIASGETTIDETADYARVIGTAAARMTHIIRQLLEFARKKGPTKDRKDIEPLVEEAVGLLRPLAQKKDIALEIVKAASTLNTKASVDSAQFEQVITNLVMNAIQATPKERTVRISVSREVASAPWELRERELPYLRVQVEDQGLGIAPEHLPHIFEPFYTTKDVGEGTGLGLSVSYGIVQEHGGWIAVESVPGRGSTFSVFLPPSESP